MATKPKLKRVQTLFRLWNDDLEKFKVKIVQDNTTLQRLMETFVKAYLKDDPSILKIIKKSVTENGRQRRRYNVDEFEADAILKRLEEQSPLQDINIIFNESENK